MKRNSLIHRLWQNWVPPALRDKKWLFRFLLRTQKANPRIIEMCCEFKEKLPYMSSEDIVAYYERFAQLTAQPTGADLCVGSDTVSFIQGYANEHPQFHKWLDCACGGGGLSLSLAAIGLDVTGVDFVIREDLLNNEKVTFIEADIRELPFEEASFDVTVSAHTLEHIVQIQKAISELRRVTKHTLIVIVPCQREYLYTYDFHVHFFPYKEAFHRIMENPNAECFISDNDIVYIEKITKDHR